MCGTQYLVVAKQLRGDHLDLALECPVVAAVLSQTSAGGRNTGDRRHAKGVGDLLQAFLFERGIAVNESFGKLRRGRKPRNARIASTGAPVPEQRESFLERRMRGRKLPGRERRHGILERRRLSEPIEVNHRKEKARPAARVRASMASCCRCGELSWLFMTSPPAAADDDGRRITIAAASFCRKL